MIKQITIILIVLLLISSVVAQVSKPIDIKPSPIQLSKVGLQDEQIAELSTKGIKDIKIIEYPCEDNIRCFAIDGDIKDKLVKIPTRVKDNCIQNVTIEMISRYDKKLNRSITIGVKKRTCTGVYNYRDITEDEVNRIVDESTNKKIESKLDKPIDEYYPIKQDIEIKMKEISIGKSIGQWTSKLLKPITDLIEEILN